MKLTRKDLSEEILRSLFDGTMQNHQSFWYSDRQHAAVLVPLLDLDGEWFLLFTKRTETIKNHKGQVSFPGGMAEVHENSPITTALRETEEEIGVESDDIQTIGLLDSLVTPTKLVVFPVVGIIKWPIVLRISQQEVSRVFFVPLDWFAKERNMEIRNYRDQFGREREVKYYAEYDGEIVWGITAEIISRFIATLIK